MDALEAVFGNFQAIFNSFFWALRNIKMRKQLSFFATHFRAVMWLGMAPSTAYLPPPARLVMRWLACVLTDGSPTVS